MHFTLPTIVLALAVSVSASPLESHTLSKRAVFNPAITGCTTAQTKAIKDALADVAVLAARANTQLKSLDPKKYKGYSNYFTESNLTDVKKAFNVFDTAAPVKFNIQCSKVGENECSSGSFAVTEPTAETFATNGRKAGIRSIYICPFFFESPRTKRRIPQTAAEITEFCKFKESKKYTDFETGGMLLYIFPNPFYL